MQSGTNNGESIDLQIQEAISVNRLPNDSDSLVSSVVSQEINTLADNVSLSTTLGGRYEVYNYLLLFY